MGFVENVLEKAANEPKRIVLPEGGDDRVIEAACRISSEGIAELIILGAEDVLRGKLEGGGADMSRIKVIDPASSDLNEKYAEVFTDIRKYRGMTIERARETVKDSVYFGTMMVKTGEADGLVAGAAHSTADTIRPALQIIKPIPGYKTISSVFFMCFDDETFVFADCAIVENPTASQLSDIAILTAATSIQFGIEPRIAMLSYSTKGSSRGEGSMKVVQATERARDKINALFGFGGSVVIDGELQFDSAFVPEVASKKCPGSVLGGKANVFIFPDLHAGNICYKAVQRFCGIDAVGPVLQGLAKPVNDLSRGCNADEIVATVAITGLQAANS